jgi:hypothetical protein
MPNGLKSGLTRFVLWDYPRGSRQYDVMVVLILAFIFLTPRALFRDQPRIPRANKIAILPAEHGSGMLWIDPELLSGVPENQRVGKLNQILKNGQPVLRLQEIYDDSEHELKGYIAFTNP